MTTTLAPMTTIVTGVEHSGTGLVARIVRTGVPDALHHAQPHIVDDAPWWWTGSDFPEARFVVVMRDRIYRNRSSVGRGQSPQQARNIYDKALPVLSRLKPAYWLSYEALVIDPTTQMENLGRWLGISLSLPVEVYDANRPWS